MRQGAGMRSERPWREALGRAVEVVAGLTAVDGATLINDQYELLAFGAKIGTREGGAQVEQVLTTEPVVGAAASVVNPNIWVEPGTCQRRSSSRISAIR